MQPKVSKILIQDLPDAFAEPGIDVLQTQAVLMDRGFTDAEFLCGGADRSPVLYDVKSETFRPLLHVFFQTLSLPASSCSILCGERQSYAGKHAETGKYG